MKHRRTKTWFLGDFLANFNRRINIRAYTKIINGKVVNVSKSQRKLLRIKDALTDLRRRGGKKHEGGYIVPNINGKISRYVEGNHNSVDLELGKRHRDLNFLHNHPDNSGLSLGDLLSASHGGITIHSVTPRGSWYRAKVVPDLEKYLRDPSKFQQRQSQLIERFLESKESNPNFVVNEKQWDNASAAAQHAFLLDLKERGLIKYRAKLTDKDKRIIKFYQPEISAYLKRDTTKDYR